MIKLLQRIEYKTLITIILSLCAIKYALFELPQFKAAAMTTALDNWTFISLLVAILCIVTAGHISRNQLTNKDNTNVFIGLTVIGVLLGIYTTWQIDRNSYAIFFLIISAGMHYLTTIHKKTLFLGNILYAILISSCILVFGIIELTPMITDNNRDAYLFVFKLLSEWSLFVFGITVLIKTIQDIIATNNDYQNKQHTLPIAIGRKRSKYIAFAICASILFSCTYYTLTYLSGNSILLFFGLFFVIGPLFFCCIKLITAKTIKQLTLINNTLEIIVPLTTISALVFKISSLC